VILTGQVPTALIGNDAFQEADIIGITRPCTKHNFLVKDVKDLAVIMKKAFYIARTGRPGPVVVDLPKDVQIAQTEFKYPEHVEIRGYKPTVEGHPKQVEKAVSMIMGAKRPVIYAGGGVILGNAAEELTALAKRLGIPVTTTLMALGAFPEDDSLSLGLLGMHGTYYANMAVSNCDVLIAVAARFDDRVTGKIAAFAPHAKIVHIDVDPTSIKKNVRVDLPIVGDVREVLMRMLKMTEEKDENAAYREKISPWIAEIGAWKEKHPVAYRQAGSTIKPQYVIQRLRALSEADAIVATDVGQHQMWTAQFFGFNKPRTLLSSGGLGTMGYGLPAAMGAQAGCPGRQVICVVGDGGFQMNMQELATMVQNRLDVKICILNNNFLGMVRQWQELFFDKRYSSTCMELPIDFIKLAEAFGATGLRATKVDEVDDVIRKGFETKGPVLMEFKVAREEKVLPMVPAGASLTEMVLAS
jgi:acetolactate synthase I/II/III large subunit